ncbi:MAG TPA: M55 family metallopeptidase [Vicinamibacterales bacterium]|nr:M55 family metallopeptidase [Vicinamibacterales bacterium]
MALLIVLLAAFALGSVALAGPAAQQPPARDPGKVFISVDMEGVAGVVQPSQLGPTGFEYSRAREWMTAEALAAMEGARAGGATSFVVADSHGNAQNLLIDQFPDEVRIVRGFPRPLSMMQGIDDTFAAAVFIGYHASEMTSDAVRGHTFSSAKLLGVSLNGTEVSEGMFNAAIAGHFGVPVVFVSGDRKAVEQMQAAVAGIGAAIVKDPLGYHSAVTVTPQRARTMIRDGVRSALAQRIARQPYRVQTPVNLEVGFKLTLDAERASYVPGLSRAGAHAVRGTFPDIITVVRLIQVLTSLEPPV